MSIVSGIRDDFPLLKNTNTVYLDSAATALKPQSVIDAISSYYADYSANVFRGLYPLSAKATEEYQKSREQIAKLIHASAEEIVFTSGTTGSVNLVAYAWGRLNIGKNDEIVTSVMEHHSNFIPWQELASENGAVLKVLDIDSAGMLVTNDGAPQNTSGYNLTGIVTKKTKLVALTHVSNVLGTINPIREIVTEVKRINPHCLVFIDGAQAVPHMSVNVKDLSADFYAFSGHKMMGPTGIGVLWGRKELLSRMPPFQFGGSMIESVELKKTRYAASPEKFEAGTPHISGAIGMSKAAEYMQKIGIEAVREHERDLTEYAIERLRDLNDSKGPKRLVIYGPDDMNTRSGVLSFNIFTKEKKLIHAHDVADILGRENTCVRAGHHCAMPLAKRLGVPASIRASIHVYNNRNDIDHLVNGLKKTWSIFK